MHDENLVADITATVLEAQVFSRKHLVLELDFSPASIDALEEHADTLDFALAGGRSEANVELLVSLWGAYLGEAIRRKTDGHWTRLPDDRLGLLHGEETIFPHDQVRRRLEDGPQFSLAAFYQSVTQSS